MLFFRRRLSAFAYWFWGGLLAGVALSIPLLGRDLKIMLAWDSAAGEHPWLMHWATLSSRSFFGDGSLGALDISHLIVGMVVVVHVLSCLGLLGVRGAVYRFWSGYWLACLLCFFAVNRGMKLFFARVRPSDLLRGEIDYTLAGPFSQYEFVDALSKGSFASGHTTTALVLLPLAFLALNRAWKTAPVLFILALAWGLIVGWGRVINGSHYPTDILWAAVVCIWICAYVQERFFGPPELSGGRTGLVSRELKQAAWLALGLFLIFFTATGVKETVFRFTWWWPVATTAGGLAAWFCLQRLSAIKRSQ